MTATRTGSGGVVPTDCWYAAASGVAVGRSLLPLRACGRPVVLLRTTDGQAVALEDRCAHRAYPLSAGRLEGDRVRCGLCGFVYDISGRCVGVPTQDRVPFGANVTVFPVRESDGIVWVWLGDPGRAQLRRTPELPWLADPGWATVGGQTRVAAGFQLLHENFADVTQVPFLAPEISPTVLAAVPPPLEVVVSETRVRLRREFPPAALPAWQSRLAGRARDEQVTTTQEAFFISPAAWVDHWDVQAPDGSWLRLRFTQLVTPLDQHTSLLHWRVSRDFAVADPDATELLTEMFGGYYRRVAAAMETIQQVLDLDGPGPEVNVSADVAAMKVRDIIAALLAEEGGGATRARQRHSSRLPNSRPEANPAAEEPHRS